MAGQILSIMAMPSVVSMFPRTSPTKEVSGQVVQRRLANFHPSVWGDFFLRYDTDSNPTDSNRDSTEGTFQKLVVEVRAMLTSEAGDLLEKLELIDQVQRLGIAYHFEKEMGEQLSKLHDVYSDFVNNAHCNGREHLHTVALYFRLLRQQGYNISCEVFKKFKDNNGKFDETDNNGKFDETVIGEVSGMLSLYEASHMMVHGEDILQEALDFTTAYLKSIDEEKQSPHLVNLVKRALTHPIRKGLPRLEAWHYIQTYQNNTSKNQVLLTLAKLDFNSLQKIHQKEICEIVRWWKDWDFPGKTSFARDRIVECYFWKLGMYFEPEFAFARKFSTKVIALASVMDDMYDSYGTLDELEVYTKALQEWDEDAIEGLPSYMQLHYRALLAFYRETETKLANQGKLYRLRYAIQSMKDLATAYLAEERWFHQKYTPMLDEYMALATQTSGYGTMITSSLVGMGDVVTEEAFNWVSSNPQMMMACKIAARLMDDVAGHKFEQKRGHVASAVQCYLKEFGGTEIEAEEALTKRVHDAWKDINQAFLHPFAVPLPVLMRVLNLLRATKIMYEGNHDNYTHPGSMMKSIIDLMLVDPLPM